MSWQERGPGFRKMHSVFERVHVGMLFKIFSHCIMGPTFTAPTTGKMKHVNHQFPEETSNSPKAFHAVLFFGVNVRFHRMLSAVQTTPWGLCPMCEFKGVEVDVSIPKRLILNLSWLGNDREQTERRWPTGILRRTTTNLKVVVKFFFEAWMSDKITRCSKVTLPPSRNLALHFRFPRCLQNPGPRFLFKETCQDPNIPGTVTDRKCFLGICFFLIILAASPYPPRESTATTDGKIVQRERMCSTFWKHWMKLDAISSKDG